MVIILCASPSVVQVIKKARLLVEPGYIKQSFYLYSKTVWNPGSTSHKITMMMLIMHHKMRTCKDGKLKPVHNPLSFLFSGVKVNTKKAKCK